MKQINYIKELCILITVLSVTHLFVSCNNDGEREFSPKAPIEGVWQSDNDHTDIIIRMEFTNNGISKFYSFKDGKLQDFEKGTWCKTDNYYAIAVKDRWLTCKITNDKLEIVGLEGCDKAVEFKRSAKMVQQLPLAQNSVDLGLTVLWHMWNQGASNPDGRGDYFIYDDLENKDYDAGWRLPTRAEFKELCEECYWIWTVHDGVPGYEVTGTNGNSIFMPASGRKEGGEYKNVGIYGYYWSGTIEATDSTMYISRLEFYHSGVCNIDFVNKINMLTNKPHSFVVRLVHE